MREALESTADFAGSGRRRRVGMYDLGALDLRQRRFLRRDADHDMHHGMGERPRKNHADAIESDVDGVADQSMGEIGAAVREDGPSVDWDFDAHARSLPHRRGAVDFGERVGFQK